ncbi:MAG: hypothetical protein SGPRY_000465, partial [Prymnesium sp.]
MLVPACSARVAMPPRLPPAHMSHAEPPLSNRRALLACSLLPLLLPPPPAHALPFFLSARSAVQVSELASPSVCQARLRDQDFAVITYVGRFADGRVFDNRYETTPLVYELGGFYLDGVDQVLEDRCVGSKLLLRWKSSPPLKG